MCPLALYDEMDILLGEPGIRLNIEGAELSSGQDNLIWKAADLFLKKTSSSQGVSIRLIKKIPMGGGLGGGSSDAASVLLALNQLHKNPLSLDELSEIAALLGSDVPFFLYGQPAVCRGRGEKVEPVELRDLPWVLLLNPGFGVPTPWAYKSYASHPQKGEPGKSFNWGKTTVTLRNDLEPPVFSKYLWIAETKQWLRETGLCLDSLMSGSGATVFALIQDESVARQLIEKAREHLGPQTFLHAAPLLTHVWHEQE